MLFAQQDDGRKVRNFSLSSTFLEEYMGQQPSWGPLGYFTYKRTYARPLEEGGTEEFWQTCKRVIEGVYNIQKIHCRSLRLQWNEPKAQKSAQEMFERMWSFKWLPPGRGLWVMGTEMIHSKGSAALNNCAFVSTEEIDVDFAAPFSFLMDMSMLGVGVGGDTKGSGKIKIQVPRFTDEPYVVEDSREGWVELTKVILNSFVGKGYYPKKVDYSNVRKRGAKINGFGGVASGPQPLIDLADNITELLMPQDGEPYKITSAHIVDIFNFVGKCVVSGGIRRTAEIMFGEPTDQEFITLKQDKAALEDRRWASNNSVFGEVGMDYTDIAKSIAVNGEPGVIWLNNMQHYRRMNGERNNYDVRAMGSNPCSEQTLESFELCCLVETFPAHHDSFADYQRTLKFAYLYAKTVTLVPTHDSRTNAVMMRNRRIGCSMSGIVQAINKLGRRKFLEWCERGYGYIRDLDRMYSEWLCIPRSIKVTSVKPSGTVSLLCGATAGIHYPHSEYYIRNIRVANTSPLVEAAVNAGYKVEPDTYADDTSCISFPIREKDFDKCKKDVSIWEQFANAADLQKYWADNQVSITITFREREARDIKSCLEIYETKLKSVSLLPLLDDAHGYKQAPYIEIDKKKYDSMISKLKPIDLSASRHEVTEKFCDGDSCVL
jgi:adenosylcobalamin-dependent ribonucleoside-triphosphate reductase